MLLDLLLPLLGGGLLGDGDGVIGGAITDGITSGIADGISESIVQLFTGSAAGGSSI